MDLSLKVSGLPWGVVSLGGVPSNTRRGTVGLGAFNDDRMSANIGHGVNKRVLERAARACGGPGLWRRAGTPEPDNLSEEVRFGAELMAPRWGDTPEGRGAYLLEVMMSEGGAEGREQKNGNRGRTEESERQRGDSRRNSDVR